MNSFWVEAGGFSRCSWEFLMRGLCIGGVHWNAGEKFNLMSFESQEEIHWNNLMFEEYTIFSTFKHPQAVLQYAMH